MIGNFGREITFNVADLVPYHGEDLRASRSTPFQVGEDDEDIPSPLPTFPNEIRIGPITRARAKLLEQQVNSLPVESDIFVNENFILPKSLHLCIIRFVKEASLARGGEELQKEDSPLISNISKCAREEREEGAPGNMEEIKHV